MRRYILIILLCCLTVSAEEKIISNQVVIDMKNGTMDVFVEGGNKFSNLECNTKQVFDFNLTRTENLECVCEEANFNYYFNNFTRNFNDFVVFYNTTVGVVWDECSAIRTENANLEISNEHLRDVINSTSNNETRDYWFNLYDEERERLERCNQQSSSNCESEVNAAKKDKMVGWIGGFIIGIIVTYVYLKKDLAKNPSDELSKRSY